MRVRVLVLETDRLGMLGVLDLGDRQSHPPAGSRTAPKTAAVPRSSSQH